MTSWEWADGYPSRGVSAETAGSELDAISKKIGRAPNARDVVSAASNKKSPLHPLFTWGNAQAAKQWREDEARRLLRGIIRITYENKEERRAPYRVSIHNGHFGAAEEQHLRVYPTRESVLDDPKLRAQLVARAWDELESWSKRYSDMEEFTAVLAAIRSARKKAAA